MEIIEGYPVLTITYGKSGKAKDSKHAEKLKAFVKDEGLEELLVLSHGWNNSASEAKSLYKGLLKQLRKSMDKDAKLKDRKTGVMAVIWPSKKFNSFETEEDTHGGGAASAVPEIDDPLDDARALAEELEDDLSPAQRQSLIDAAEAAIDDKDEWAAFLKTLEELLPNDTGDGDEADAMLFGAVKDPLTALAQFDDIDAGGGEDMHTGGAAGGMLSGAAGAVGSVLNFATFYVMKRRAGKVGQHGVAKTLVGLRTGAPGLRIHFAGHSFGARVLTMAAHALNGQSSAAPDSMTLLQAAFSHNSFSASFPPPNKPGFFRNVMSNNCVRGPILVSHTFNDIPVRVAYSIASALSGDNSAFIGSKPSQYGGLGANGAQFMGSEAVNGKMLDTGKPGYDFDVGKIYNLNSDKFIKGHSKIKVPQVGYAMAKAMAATL